MSSPDTPLRTLVLAEQAQEDDEDRLNQTLQRWGERQHDRYAAPLYDAFLVLVQQPAIGHHSRQLPTHYRLLPVGRHLVAYRFTDTMIYVVRIVHDRMDLCRHVTEEDTDTGNPPH